MCQQITSDLCLYSKKSFALNSETIICSFLLWLSLFFLFLFSFSFFLSLSRFWSKPHLSPPFLLPEQISRDLFSLKLLRKRGNANFDLELLTVALIAEMVDYVCGFKKLQRWEGERSRLKGSITPRAVKWPSRSEGTDYWRKPRSLPFCAMQRSVSSSSPAPAGSTISPAPGTFSSLSLTFWSIDFVDHVSILRNVQFVILIFNSIGVYIAEDDDGSFDLKEKKKGWNSVHHLVGWVYMNGLKNKAITVCWRFID